MTRAENTARLSASDIQSAGSQLPYEPPLASKKCSFLALLLASLDQAQHLGDPRAACLRALGTLDPAHVPIAVKGRQRFEERPGLCVALQGGQNVRRKRIGLRSLRREHDLDLRAGLDTN